MRWKLIRRRLSISAPRMTVRSHLPWPLRWALMAVVLGLSAAIALWAFEFGRGIAGLDHGSKEELARLRDENKRLLDEREQLVSTANTADSLLKTEKAAQEKLAAQLTQMSTENSQLKDDLRFFEKLIPSNEPQHLSIRALQVESGGPNLWRYRMLVIQAGKNPPEFEGRYELTLSGTQAGQPWTATLPSPGQPGAAQFRLSFKSYQRIEGSLSLPEGTVIKSVQARVMDKSGVRSTQQARL